MTATLSALVCALTPAATARAATVAVENVDSCLDDVACSKYAAGHPVPVTVFTGTTGEANRVTVMREGDTWAIRDAGAPLSGCPPIDGGVRCPVTAGEGERIPGLRILLGDGDDSVTLTSDVPASVDAGAGADTVTGGSANETIDGGPGADTLNGGPGLDTLSFASRTVPVSVDLAAGTTGEGDHVVAFETVLGGQAGDVLRGSRGSDTLLGGPGADRLLGGAGDDSLDGGRGSDRLFGEGGDDTLSGDPEQGDDYYTPIIKMGDDLLDGGPGDDRLEEAGGGHNVFRGGPGRDEISGGTAADRVLGGPGRDRIVVRGGGRDNVNCGSGRDTAIADHRDALRSC